MTRGEVRRHMLSDAHAFDPASVDRLRDADWKQPMGDVTMAFVTPPIDEPVPSPRGWGTRYGLPGSGIERCQQGIDHMLGTSRRTSDCPERVGQGHSMANAALTKPVEPIAIA